MKKWLVVVAALAACGGSKHEAQPPAPVGSAAGSAEPAMGSAGSADGSGSAAPAASEAGSAAGSGDKAYKDMDKKERAAFMKRVVLPKAKAMFASFDPKFGEVTCRTCHGDGVDDKTFKMPNPKLKPLPGTEEAYMAWIKKNPEEGKWSKFMGEQVVPAMADMLGKQAFDPKTKTGDFSCGACHTMQK